jgi:hypothetical protein
MQSNPDRDMKFILVHQDHLTKFVLLVSLHSKRADEVTSSSGYFHNFWGTNNSPLRQWERILQQNRKAFM